MISMHRVPAVMLLLAFSLPLFMPAVYATPESQLPACCRSHGKHACATMSSSGSTSTPSLKAEKKCPFFPNAGAAPVSGKATFLRTDATPAAELIAAHPAAAAQTEARYRISFSRSWQKRGPPLV